MTGRSRSGRQWWVGGFLAPATVLFLGFAVVPIVVAVVVSFCDWTGVAQIRFAGLDNWARLLHDESSQAALARTGVVVVGSWFAQVPASLVLGIFAAGRQRYRSWFTTVYFLPLLISAASLGVLWTNLLSPLGGGIQYAARHWGLGLLDRQWLGDPNLVMWAVIALIAWEFIPFHTLIFQAAVRQIPASLYEAAMLDGVGPWQKFAHITLPMLRNTIITVSTLNIVGSLTVFDLIYTLTGGGPGESTRVLALQQYLVGFSDLNYGYASVLAVVLGVVGVLVSVVIIGASGFGKMESTTEGAA